MPAVASATPSSDSRCWMAGLLLGGGRVVPDPLQLLTRPARALLVLARG